MRERKIKTLKIGRFGEKRGTRTQPKLEDLRR